MKKSPWTMAALVVALVSLGALPATAAMKGMGEMGSRYGGPVYDGPPALTVTASLVKAGGGPENFSIATALTSMVGPNLVGAEVKKLTRQYGKARVGSWITVFNFAVSDALQKATAAGVTLPEGNLSGKALAATLVKAGLDKKGTFYTEYLLDKAVTHKIHMAVMDDIDAKYGVQKDEDYHRITNQAMADLAHALGAKTVKVASLH
ncbi:MAG: hypothetical protein JO250_00115 [Armatimonadetes bacterium]|nr:hypothetical protein [Armatimonadota bacterium]